MTCRSGAPGDDDAARPSILPCPGVRRGAGTVRMAGRPCGGVCRVRLRQSRGFRCSVGHARRDGHDRSLTRSPAPGSVTSRHGPVPGVPRAAWRRCLLPTGSAARIGRVWPRGRRTARYETSRGGFDREASRSASVGDLSRRFAGVPDADPSRRRRKRRCDHLSEDDYHDRLMSGRRMSTSWSGGGRRACTGRPGLGRGAPVVRPFEVESRRTRARCSATRGSQLGRPRRSPARAARLRSTSGPEDDHEIW